MSTQILYPLADRPTYEWRLQHLPESLDETKHLLRFAAMSSQPRRLADKSRGGK